MLPAFAMAIPPNVLRLIMESAASPPPPGHVSNFVNPENQLISSAVAQMVCFGVATVVVAMRLYTKLRITKDMGWDDCKPDLRPLAARGHAC